MSDELKIREKIATEIETIVEGEQVTFNYNPKGDKDWYVSVKSLKELSTALRNPEWKIGDIIPEVK